MSNKRRKWTDEELIYAVSVSSSIWGAMRYMGLKCGGGATHVIKSHIKRLQIDTSHFLGKKIGREYAAIKNTRPLDEILIENSTYQGTSTLKRRLIKEGVLSEKCSICGIGNEWNGSYLSLQLDHISGDRSDNRIGNLRILCPNCHSQTDSYAGKNKNRNAS